jgi:hypothetical protein
MARLLFSVLPITDSYGIVFTGTVRIYYSFEESCCGSGCNGSYLAVRVANGVVTQVAAVSGFNIVQLGLNPPALPDNTLLQLQFVRGSFAAEGRVCRCKDGIWTLTADTELATVIAGLSESSFDSNSFLRTALATALSDLATAQSQRDGYAVILPGLIAQTVALEATITQLQQTLTCCQEAISPPSASFIERKPSYYEP